MAPSIAVVVPTYNRILLLERTLDALGSVDYDAMQVVVVDDGSVEPHAARAVAATERAGARYIRQPNAGPAAARNAGIRATRSKLVAFLDDDCAPAADWLQHLAAAFASADGSLGGVGGSVRSQPPHNWMSAFCAAADYSAGEQPVFTNAATANACFRRSVLDEVGGFDEAFRHPGGDDPDLSRRVREAGYELRFVPEAVVYHSELDTLGDFLKHLFHRGIGEARSKRKEGRPGRVVVRALLLPLFCLRRARHTWRVSAGKAGIPTRMAYAALDFIGGIAFVAGSLKGLVVGRWR